MAYKGSQPPLFIGICGALAVAISTYVAWCLSSTPPQDRVPRGVTITGADMGTVWPQSAFLHRLVLMNDGDDAISLVGVDQSCGCTSVQPAHSLIAAHGSLSVDVVEYPPNVTILPVDELSDEFCRVLRVATHISETGPAESRIALAVGVDGAVEEFILEVPIRSFGLPERISVSSQPGSVSSVDVDQASLLSP